MSTANDDPVIFHYSASCNISFHGEDESGYTWRQWREMNGEERDSARTDFVFNILGVEVWEDEDE